MVKRERLRSRVKVRPTLRNRIFIIICATLAGLVLILYFVSHRILLSSFDEMERCSACQNIERVLSALDHELAGLEATATDWASWDDTYAFVQDADPRYLRSNIVDGTFTDLRLDLIIYINSNGEVVLGRLFEDSRQKQVPPGVIESLSGIISAEPGAAGGVSGVSMLSYSPALISAQPILPSSGQGSPRGVLLMARYLDAAEIEYISEVTRFPIRLHSFTGGQFPSGLCSGTETYIEPLDRERLAGYTVLKDMHGAPALVLEVAMPRTVYPQAQKTMNYLILLIIGTSLLSGVTIAVLFEKQVLSRLLYLERKVSRVAASGDLSTRVSISGNDEISMSLSRENVRV